MRLTRILLTTVLAACIGLLTAPANASGAPPRAAASTHAVAISGYAFAPASLTITAGDTVTWTNADQAPHDVTTTSAPVAIHGSRMDKGQTWSYTFTTPGTYAYLCSFHPDMKATVIVKPAATSKAAPPPAPAPRTTTHAAVARPAGRIPMPTRHRSKPRAASSRASSPPVETPAAASSAPAAVVPVAAAPPPSSAPERPLRPLLLVAGIIAAVTTLSLLLLAARPETPRSSGEHLGAR